jgi:20S proteasome subunit alpha 4
MAAYDRALTRFSPDGKLFQIDYAFEAVKRGSAVVAVTGTDCVVIGVERKAVAKLQDPRTMYKIVKLDENVTMAFAGLNADARVLVEKVRIECQSYRLTCEEAPSLEYVARHLARVQQKFTQRGGVRPFGISSVLCGFGSKGEPKIYQVDPSGTYFAWKADAIGGRNFKSMREMLEREWAEEMTEAEALKLTITCLLEVVDSGSKNMEIVVVRPGAKPETLAAADIDPVVAAIVAAAEEAKAAPAASS